MAKKYPLLSKILKKLLFDKGMKPIDLAREVNIPPPTIHRLVTGKSTRPYKSSLAPIAEYFSISIGELIGDKALADNQSTHSAVIKPAPQGIHYLPLIPWENLNEMINHLNLVKEVPFAGSISEESYATILNDSSMEPLFPRGSMLLFDPGRAYRDRSYVLVKLHETSTPVFRQLILDLDQKYLKPLNPDLTTFKMRLLGENDTIHAVLVEARQAYNEF